MGSCMRVGWVLSSYNYAAQVVQTTNNKMLFVYKQQRDNKLLIVYQKTRRWGRQKEMKYCEDVNHVQVLYTCQSFFQ